MAVRNIAHGRDERARLVSFDALAQKGFGFPSKYRVTRFPVGGGLPESTTFFSDYNNAYGLYINLKGSK